MLKIRLSRVGKKKNPTYRFIVSESARDPFGKALEILGHHNPFTKVTEVDKERALYWISQGAQLSPTVHNMFVDQNVIQTGKVRASGSGKKKATAQPDQAPAAAATTGAEAAAKPPAVEQAKQAPEAPSGSAPEEKPEEDLTQEPTASNTPSP